MNVAVLMAVYRNDDPTLFNRAIESVLEQRVPSDVSIRIYLGVDGPLPPLLEQAVQAIEPKLYQVSRSENNIGLAATLNRLIGLRKDEAFLFRMDADDKCRPNRFARQLEYMANNPTVAILGTDILEVDSQTGTQRIVQFHSEGDDVRESICKRVPVAHPTVCFRSTVFEKIPGYPLINGNEDIAMWFSCLQHGFAFGNIHEVLLEFSISDSFWSRRSKSKAWSECKTYIQGIHRLHGANWRLAYPILRFLMRISPSRFQKAAYSRLR